MSELATDYREVGKEYRNTTIVTVMAVMSYVVFLASLGGALATGHMQLLVVMGWSLPFGIACHYLHRVGGGSHYTVLSHSVDADGNPRVHVKYRHGETGYLPARAGKESTTRKFSY